MKCYFKKNTNFKDVRRKVMKFQPVVKWSGSKRSQSETIVSKIERKQYNTYYEPFCGGCSIIHSM